VLHEHLNLYVGFDSREEYGTHTFVSSVLHHCSIPVKVAFIGEGLFNGVRGFEQRDGSNRFTYGRFLVPWLEGYTGWALFCDGADMLARADLAELWRLRNFHMAVQVVKHEYKTKHPRKYIGTEMECDNRDYPGKNFSSVALINCSHFAWRNLNPDTVREMSGETLHQFKFIPQDRIGSLALEWNWLCQEYGPNEKAKIVHYSAGIPAFPHYSQTEMADEWASAALKVTHATS